MVLKKQKIFGEKMKQATLIKNCQMCNSKKLESVLFLGYLPPVNHLYPVGSYQSYEHFFPLELIRCLFVN